MGIELGQGIFDAGDPALGLVGPGLEGVDEGLVFGGHGTGTVLQLVDGVLQEGHVGGDAVLSGDDAIDGFTNGIEGRVDGVGVGFEGFGVACHDAFQLVQVMFGGRAVPLLAAVPLGFDPMQPKIGHGGRKDVKEALFVCHRSAPGVNVAGVGGDVHPLLRRGWRWRLRRLRRKAMQPAQGTLQVLARELVGWVLEQGEDGHDASPADGVIVGVLAEGQEEGTDGVVHFGVVFVVVVADR